MADEFDFNDRGDEFDEAKVAFDEMAKIMAPMFRALTRNGLTGQEAAALTAAYWAQNMPTELQGPIDGS